MTLDRLSAPAFADLVGISRRKASQALARAAQGKPWRRTTLDVVAIEGRGGRSGVCYEVALSSLSEALQSRYWADHGHDVHGPPGNARQVDVGNDFQRPAPASPAPAAPIGCGYQPAPNQSATIEYRWRVIQEAADTRPRTAARRDEIARAAKKWGEPPRTIYGWLKRLEDAGGDVNALARKRPADAGERRVQVSRAFDKRFLAAGLDAALLAEIASRIDQLIKAAWASRAQRAGWQQVRREVVTQVARELRERGITIAPAERELSHRRIYSSSRFRLVDIRANDRKRYDDNKPRIRRDNSALAPMAQVVMDVKPLDVVMRRPDGSEVWPKMIGFQDTGTHRLFAYFVQLGPGEGIRQEHVADAFIAMVSDPEWGFPQQLYRDNGSEFYLFDKIRAALELINEPGAKTIINAKAYSGASKPIESKFATLDRAVFSQMDGWAGGNRMNKKTQTVGKPPKPFGGSFDDFVTEASRRLAVFEYQEIGSGVFAGRSPARCYAEHVANGWRPVRVDPIALEAAFATMETRQVARGSISVNGQRYRHPDLPNGQTVTVALPYQRGRTPMVQLTSGWALLQEDMPYLPGDIAGAVESGRQQRAADRHVRELRREAGTIDLAANLDDRVVALPGRAAPAPLIDLTLSEQAPDFAGARIAARQERAEAVSADDHATRRRKALTAILEKQHANG